MFSQKFFIFLHFFGIAVILTLTTLTTFLASLLTFSECLKKLKIQEIFNHLAVFSKESPTFVQSKT